jgi:hypothetical protein
MSNDYDDYWIGKKEFVSASRESESTRKPRRSRKRIALQTESPPIECSPRHRDPKALIKLEMLKDLDLRAQDLKPRIDAMGLSVSLVTLSNIRSELRHTIKLLKAQGRYR